MIAWWDSLDSLIKILYFVAVPATLILIIQTVLAALSSGGVGIDGSDTSGLHDFGGHANLDGGSSLSELSDASDLGDMRGHTFMDGGNPADLGTMQLFTVQGVVAFLTVFSWSSIVSLSNGAKPIFALGLGIFFGLVAMFLIAKLIHLSLRLTEDGTVNLKNAIGNTGKVYIPIPSKSSGEGKITMYVQGRYTECTAITEDDNTLATGSIVRIVDFRNGILVVEEEKK